MIQKIFEKIFLAQTILNGPIRKVIIVKVKFEDLRNFFYYQVNQARHLENFSKTFWIIFSKKNFCSKSFEIPDSYYLLSWLVSPEVTMAFKRKEPLDRMVGNVPSHLPSPSQQIAIPQKERPPLAKSST